MRPEDHPEMPSDDGALDALLSLWANQHSLSDSQSEAIRRNLLRTARATPPELPYSWWRRVFQPIVPAASTRSAHACFQYCFRT